ncbi:MAG: hypothetical protein IKA12_00635 [Clostridia bacterium]|nr:hypothetical protein [Clostridia bacterium]
MSLSKITAIILSAFCILFTCFYGAKKIGEKKEFTNPVEYKGVLNLWHIETFEGGHGSRKQFLMDVATSFEKQNDGVLIMVISHTESSANEALNLGEKPDIISYGAGTIYTDIKEIQSDYTFIGGKVEDKTYAIPWCKGGYVLFENPKYNDKKTSQTSIMVSKSIRNTPLLNICLDEKFAGYDVVYEKPSLDAYVEFVNGKHKYMLGTQRDVVRFSNRGFNIKAQPLTQYNDLYQYLSLVSTDDVKTLYSEKFINYLLSEQIQKKLYKISMFSEFYTNEYQNEILNAMQNVSPKYTVSAFSSPQLIEDLSVMSTAFIKGDKTVLAKIKNVLILP